MSVIAIIVGAVIALLEGEIISFGDGQNKELTIWYEDYDGDGYGATPITKRSKEKPKGYIDKSGDCDDKNAKAYPDAPDFHVMDRGNNIYDFNCDKGKEEKKYDKQASCEPLVNEGQGWWGPVPECGKKGRWLVSCLATRGKKPTLEIRTQACR